MADASWLFLMGAMFASLAGVAWLALAMDTHWREVSSRTSPDAGTQRTLRVLGGAGLAVSAALCLLADHPSMAILVWVMLLSGAVVAIAFTLAWKPILLRALWPFGMRAK